MFVDKDIWRFEKNEHLERETRRNFSSNKQKRKSVQNTYEFFNLCRVHTHAYKTVGFLDCFFWFTFLCKEKLRCINKTQVGWQFSRGQKKKEKKDRNARHSRFNSIA